MDRREFYNLIKDREVVPFFRGLEAQLARATPSGASVHDRETLRAVLISTIRIYNRGYFPSGETIEEYHQRDKPNCDSTLNRIFSGINKYGLKV